MQSAAMLAQGTVGSCRPRSLLTSAQRPVLRKSSVHRRTFIVRADAQERAEEVTDKAAEAASQKTEEVKSTVKDTIPSNGSGGFQDRVDQAGREISKVTQEASGLTEQNTTIKRSQDGKPAFEEAMSFSGQVPERANSRLAMLAFIAAAGAELATGSPVAAQLKKSPLLIGVTFAVFMIASIIPILRGENPNKESGPFTVRAELWNGRLAMMGFIALLLTETFKGAAAL